MVKSEDGNGFIPVKYEYCDVTYDSTNKEFLATIKIGTKKLPFKVVKD